MDAWHTSYSDYTPYLIVLQGKIIWIILLSKSSEVSLHPQNLSLLTLDVWCIFTLACRNFGWEAFLRSVDFTVKIFFHRFLVIDEADRMFEKNHFEEFPCLLERINHPGNKLTAESRRQTFVFSATLSLSHAPPSYVLKKRKSKWILFEVNVSKFCR